YRRGLSAAAAAVGADRGHPPAGPRVRATRGARLRASRADLHEGGGAVAAAPSLARQRPRAPPRRREGRALGGERRDRSRRSPGRRPGSPRISPRRRRRRPLDAPRANGRLHRRDAAPRRRQPDTPRQTPRRLPQVSLGKREEITVIEFRLSDGNRWTSFEKRVSSAIQKLAPRLLRGGREKRRATNALDSGQGRPDEQEGDGEIPPSSGREEGDSLRGHREDP